MRPGLTARVALVIEDEWLVRDQIVGELTAQGWLVVGIATGEDALALLADHHVDVVFTDIRLAGSISGWDVAEALRAVKPGLPVIYTSGNAPDQSRRVAGSLFFDKPYDTAEVVRACHRLTAGAPC
jgi:CheY-like chemotaxis protein